MWPTPLRVPREVVGRPRDRLDDLPPLGDQPVGADPPDVDDRDLRPPVGKPAPRVQRDPVAVGQQVVYLDAHAAQCHHRRADGGERWANSSGTGGTGAGSVNWTSRSPPTSRPVTSAWSRPARPT